MPYQKLTEDRKKEIRSLHDNGVSRKEIVSQTGVSQSTVFKLTRRNPETGQYFASTTEYDDHRAREKGYASHAEYQNEKRRQRGFKTAKDYVADLATRQGFESAKEKERARIRSKGFKSASAYLEDLAQRKGFISYSAYQIHLAQQAGYDSVNQMRTKSLERRGFSSSGEYEDQLIAEKGFSSRAEYLEHVAKANGFESAAHYRAHLRDERRRQPENQRLSKLIKSRLREMGKNQRWLARKSEVSDANISVYARADGLPSAEKLQRIFSALEVPHETIDDLMQEA